MLNQYVKRLCSRCGTRPVATAVDPAAEVCWPCAAAELARLLAEPWRCPACDAPGEITDAPYVCPACGWDEGSDRED